MANEKRRRHNLLSGTLGAQLTSGATTITFAAALQEFGTNIATLASDEHLALIIESEIVYLTAYTAGATTGTVARGQEGSTDATHANATAWEHGPTKRDWPQIRRTVRDGGGHITTTSSTRTPIHSTDLAYLTVVCEVGDLVRCQFAAGWYNNANNYTCFDFEVDQPTSANVYVGANNDRGVQARWASGGPYGEIITAIFTVTERGVHGFRPVWFVMGGTSTVLNGSSGDGDTLVTFTVENLGPLAAPV